MISLLEIWADVVCNAGPSAATPWLASGKNRFDCNAPVRSVSVTGVCEILENGRRGVVGGCIETGGPEMRCFEGFNPFNSCVVDADGRGGSLPGLKRFPCGVGGGGIGL